jgi:Gas vesicle protein K
VSPPDRRLRLPERIDTDPESVERDLACLVLTIVELVRQLMERQALRRVDQGDLTDEQVERIGCTLMALDRRMSELRDHFGLAPEDLRLGGVPARGSVAMGCSFSDDG